MSLSSSDVSVEALPLLPRKNIILSLLRLKSNDLLSLMKVWVVDHLKTLSENKLPDKEDIEYHFDKIKSELAKLPKRTCVIKWLNEYLNQHLTPIQEAQLELSYIVKHPNKTVWTVYRLNRNNTSENSDFEARPTVVKNLLSKSLSHYFSQVVYVARYQNDLWIRIAIYPSLSVVRYPKVFLMFRPSTNFLLASPFRPDVQPYIFQAISEVFNLSSISSIPLSGKNPISLLDLALDRQSQGIYSQYRLGQIDNNVLSPDRKPLFLSHLKPYGPLPNCMVDEDRLEKGLRRNKSTKDFGPNPQPALDNLSIEFDVPIQGSTLAFSSEDIPFEMSIKFEGNNVIEGFKALSQHYQLPKFISQTHSQCSNRLKISDENDLL